VSSAPAGSTNPRDLSPDRLAEQCRWDAFRGPGPGGQKRNKTSSAVRVTHVPTGISAVAAKSRSQNRNRQAAFGRLRRRLAFELREPIQPRTSLAPPLREMLGHEGKFNLNARDEQYPSLIGNLLDLLTSTKGSVSEAAAAIGITTARLVRFLQRDEELLAVVNRVRRSAGLRNLGSEQR